MARSDRFPSAAHQDVITDLPAWLEAAAMPTTGIRITSAPLAIWEVRQGRSVLDAASPTDEWHHQLRDDERAFAFVRSRVTGDHAEIVELATSPLVPTLEVVLAKLRDSEASTTTLRLLRSARDHLTCLWLHRDRGDDEIIVLQSPHLSANERLSETAFFEKFAALPTPGMTAAGAQARSPSSKADRRYRDKRLWGQHGGLRVREVQP